MPTRTIGEGLSLVEKYGMANFLTLAILILMFFLIRYILKTGDKREARLGDIITNNLTKLESTNQSVVLALQNLQQTMRDAAALAQTRYDSIAEANRFQRIEHDKMIENLTKIHSDLASGIGCQKEQK